MPDDHVLVAIDLSEWTADRSYVECLKLCEKLKLIKSVKHGEHEYGRLTQTGINVFRCLLRMATNAANPENILRQS